MSDPAPAAKKMADYLKVVWKRKWILLAFLVLGVSGSLVYHHQQPPLYRTTMKVQISDGSGGGGRQSSAASEFLQGLFDSDRVHQTRLAVLKDPSTKRLMVTNKILGAESRPEYFKGRTKDDILDEMQKAITVSDRRGTALVDITVSGPQPDMLPTIANLFWEQFVDMQRHLQSQIMTSGLARAQREREQAYDDHAAAEKALSEHLTTQGYTRLSLETKRSWLTEENDRIQREWAATRAALAKEGGVYEKVKQALEGEGDSGLAGFDDEPFIKDSETMAKAVDQLEQLLAERKRLREEERLAARHPNILALEELIRRQEAKVASIRRTVAGLYVARHEGLLLRDEQIATERTRITSETENFVRIDRRYEDLVADLELKKGRLEYLTLAHDEIRQERDKGYNTGGIVIEPELPRQPYSPNLLLNLGAGLMIGLLLGAGLTLGLEAIDDSIRAEDEVETALKLPCLGVIHTPDSRRGGTPAVDLASIVDPRSIFAEEFRSIRTSLGFTFDRRRERHYSMLVSSFEVQEGKTTVSTNLATVIAASGLRTLLIDADMRNGRIHRTFGLQNDRGLSDLLAGEVAFDDVVEDTEIANLSVLPSGSLYDNPAEMLESPAMRELLDLLSERYDRVVFDTPPAGPVTDAFVLGKQVDAVVLVAAAGKTKKRLLRRAVKNMLAIGVRIAGVVLNEMKPGRKRYYRKYLHLYRRGA